MKSLRPYVVATQPLLLRLRIDQVEPSPLAVDPRTLASAALVDRVSQLDPIIYGSRQLNLPRWALYDCAAVPGLICGLGVAGADASDRLLEIFGEGAREAPLLPLTRAIAIPTLDPSRWLAYSVAGLADVLSQVGGDRRPDTLRLLTALLDVPSYIGVTQWRSSQLDVFARAGALRVYGAWVPAHSEPATCVYELVHNSVAETRLLDIEDEDELIALHEDIEAGAEVYIVGPRRPEGGTTVMPLGVA